ncbi:flagellar basal body-associated protein FliL [Mesorhizobium loti]|nr:flagellar basal body-associated FliL family protein [Mesorhizobium loti]PLP56963.1 flagellar basal body-associated protein FliL [Mesorhizobium loti]
MANTEQIASPKGPSLIIQMAMLLAMTGAALGVGWFAGTYLKNSDKPALPAKESHEKKTAHEAKKEGEAGPTLVDLAPMTTNLAAPAEVWARVQLSLVFDGQPPAGMAEDVHQDLLAFLRTVKMHQVEGASGYQHLRADLQERAAIRSGGKVKEVLVRTLLFE